MVSVRLLHGDEFRRGWRWWWGGYPRLISLYNTAGYDPGGSGGVGVGILPQNWNQSTPTTSPTVAGYAQAFQTGAGTHAGVTGPYFNTFTSPTNQFQIPGENYQNSSATGIGVAASDAWSFRSNLWYFVAMTYDGTLTTNQVKIWLGTTTTNVVLVQQLGGTDIGSDVASGVAFSTNAILRLANRDNGQRPITDGGIADVRIYSGLCASNYLDAIRSFSSLTTPTTTALSSSLNPSTYGSSVTFTATVQTNGVSATGATGTMVFSDGATPLATNSVASGVATYTTSGLTAGSHSFTATYSGDANFASSTSGSTNQTVSKATPVVTAPGASAIVYGQTLASSTLSGGAATNANNNAGVAGSFAFTTPTIAPYAGTTNVSVTFTPTDTTDYTTAFTTCECHCQSSTRTDRHQHCVLGGRFAIADWWRRASGVELHTDRHQCAERAVALAGGD